MPHDHSAAQVAEQPRPVSLNDAATRALARLTEAAATGVPCSPVRDLLGEQDINQAYLVQAEMIARRIRDGDRRVGRKIGLTSAAVQTQLGVDQPDFGSLLASMAVGPREVVAAGRLLQPRIEAEIAFVLGRDIDEADPSPATAAAAVDSAFAALEIVDSRIAGWNITITDTIADNASSGLFVLGPSSVPLADLDPVRVSMTLTEDGVPVSTGTGAACLGDPLLALRWLARVAVEMGDPLRAGDVVLSGALGPMVTVRPGSTYEATLTGLGAVQATFASTEG